MLFAAAGAAKPIEMPDRLFQLPSLFPFGTPLFNSGLIITSIFITILLIVNMLASMKVVDIAVKNSANSLMESIMNAMPVLQLHSAICLAV